LDRLLPSLVKRIFEILRFYNPEEQKKHGKNEPFCGIIFVEQRHVAYIMKV